MKTKNSFKDLWKGMNVSKTVTVYTVQYEDEKGNLHQIDFDALDKMNEWKAHYENDYHIVNVEEWYKSQDEDTQKAMEQFLEMHKGIDQTSPEFVKELEEFKATLGISKSFQKSTEEILEETYKGKKIFQLYDGNEDPTGVFTVDGSSKEYKSLNDARSAIDSGKYKSMDTSSAGGVPNSLLARQDLEGKKKTEKASERKFKYYVKEGDSPKVVAMCETYEEAKAKAQLLRIGGGNYTIVDTTTGNEVWRMGKSMKRAYELRAGDKIKTPSRGIWEFVSGRDTGNGYEVVLRDPKTGSTDRDIFDDDEETYEVVGKSGAEEQFGVDTMNNGKFRVYRRGNGSIPDRELEYDTRAEAQARANEMNSEYEYRNKGMDMTKAQIKLGDYIVDEAGTSGYAVKIEPSGIRVTSNLNNSAKISNTTLIREGDVVTVNGQKYDIRKASPKFREGQRVQIVADMQPDGGKMGTISHINISNDTRPGYGHGYKVNLDDGESDTFGEDEIIAKASLPAGTIDKVMGYYNNGMSVEEIASKTGISKDEVSSIIRNNRNNVGKSNTTKDICPDCKGSGVISNYPNFGNHTCETCKGTGSLINKGQVETTGKQLNRAVDEAKGDGADADTLANRLKAIQLKRQKATIAERAKTTTKSFKETWGGITKAKTEKANLPSGLLEEDVLFAYLLNGSIDEAVQKLGISRELVIAILHKNNLATFTQKSALGT